jgi:hypothetical protein
MWKSNVNSISDINDNFAMLKADIDKIGPQLRDIDLYNIQGQIREENMSEMYARLPYNSALIWFIPQKTEDTTERIVPFLNETYSNGDYILKLGNDVPLKIPHDTKGTFEPTFADNKLKYTYKATISDGANISFTLNPGANGTPGYFKCFYFGSACNTASSFDTQITASSFMPIVDFFLTMANADSTTSPSYYKEYSDPILIDYSISVATTNWVITMPEGHPVCYALLR